MKKLALVMFCLLFVLVSGSLVKAEKQSDDQRLQAIMLKLETILERMDAIEKRIASLENVIIVSADLRRDKNGILYDASGRKVGIWGVDVPSTIP
jgi:hypothetical protein